MSLPVCFSETKLKSRFQAASHSVEHWTAVSPVELVGLGPVTRKFGQLIMVCQLAWSWVIVALALAHAYKAVGEVQMEDGSGEQTPRLRRGCTVDYFPDDDEEGNNILAKIASWLPRENS
nr:unnamed protein product [Digitaria exilis]